MPNHITTVLRIKDANGMKMEDITSVFLNDKGNFDFNKIIPMPKCLEDFNPHGGITITAEAILQTPVDGNPLLGSMQISSRYEALEKYNNGETSDEDKQSIDRAIANHKECGYLYWYDWSIANWETKWNAYDQSSKDDSFSFDTAWSHPYKIIENVSKQLKDVAFNISYADEDTGSNCGTYIIKNGEIIEKYIAPIYNDMSDEEKKKYTKFAFELKNPGVDPRSYGYDKQWEYSDETYEQYEREQNEKAT